MTVMPLKPKNNQNDPKTFICKTKMTIKFLYNHSTCTPLPPGPLKLSVELINFSFVIKLLYTYCNLKDDKLSIKNYLVHTHTHTHTHLFF